jgi:hypothetical protein
VPRHAKVPRAAALLAACTVPLLAAGCGTAQRGHSAATASGAAAKDPSLVGTWVGRRQRIHRTDGFATGRARLRVTRQQGRTFRARLTRSNPDGPVTESLVGAFTPGGRLMAGGDAEGVYSFRLVGRRTLDYCYVEAGRDYRTTCARLHKRS